MSHSERIHLLANQLVKTNEEQVVKGTKRHTRFSIPAASNRVQHIQTFGRTVADVQWALVPEEEKKSVVKALEAIQKAVHALVNYDPAQSGGENAFENKRSELLGRLQQEFDSALRVVAPWLSLLSGTSKVAAARQERESVGEVKRNKHVANEIKRMQAISTSLHKQARDSEERGRKQLESVRTSLNTILQQAGENAREAKRHELEAKAIVDSIKQIAEKATVAAHAAVFKKRAEACEKKAKTWFKLTIGATVLTATFLLTVASFYLGLVTGEVPAPEEYAYWPLIAIQVSLLSLGYFLVVFGGRTQRAFLHQAAINEHRASALSCYRILADAVEGDTTLKNALVATVTRAIFDPRVTGFSTADVEIKAHSPLDQLMDKMIGGGK